MAVPAVFLVGLLQGGGGVGSSSMLPVALVVSTAIALVANVLVFVRMRRDRDRGVLLEVDRTVRSLRLPRLGIEIPLERALRLHVLEWPLGRDGEDARWRAQIDVVVLHDDGRCRRHAIALLEGWPFRERTFRRLEELTSIRTGRFRLSPGEFKISARGTNPEEIVWPLPAVEEVPLAYCPKCSYALFDLPGAKVCPECGADRRALLPLRG